MKSTEFEALETAVITRSPHGFEITDSFGDHIGSYSEWSSVAELFRRADFSDEYIANRKADLERGLKISIDETND